MTSETRVLIAPTDFKAIEFECSECRHRLVRPMAVWKTVLYACPDCGSDWSQFATTMKYLANMASQLPKFTPPKGQQWPFTIRFEIADQTHKEQP